MCQLEENISEFLACTKDMYKDLIIVGKDPDTDEIRPRSIVFRIDQAVGHNGNKQTYEGHQQNFCYLSIDPLNWHVTLFTNKWTRKW